MVIITGADRQPTVLVHIIYQSSILTSGQSADVFLPQFLTLRGFRQISEQEVKLADGTGAFQLVYTWQGQEGEAKGSLLVAARGSQNIVMQVVSSKEKYDAAQSDIQATLLSLKLETPLPLGIPRKEALTLAFDSGPVTLDPAVAQESQSIQYVTQIFGGLMAFDPQLNLGPDLAEDMPQLSADGKSYTFTIRKNAQFHDGRPVTAQDVKYSWERALRPETQSPTAKTYLDDIVGAADVLAGRATELSGVTAVAERTLRVTIDAPKVYFLAKLTHASTFVVDRKNVESGRGWWVKPNGTGPFKLKAWQFNLLLVLERNAGYHRQPAKVANVVFRLYGGNRTLMYETGEIDAAHVAVGDIKRLQDPANPLSKELTLQPELSVYYVGFNTQRPPFDDPKVRKAFMLAIDREKLSKDIFEATAQVAHGFLPPGIPSYNPNIPPIPFDVQQAKKLLAESKYGDATKLPPIVYTTSGPAPTEILVALADMWSKNLGVEISVDLLDPGGYYYLLKGNVGQLYDYGWIADYPDPHNFLDVLLHSGTDNNVGGYSNAQVDSLLDQARLEKERDKRLALYQQAERILVDDAAAIPLYFGRTFMLTKPYVKGFINSPQGVVELRLASLEGP